MDYKLICTDIDGTLLNKDRELSAVTISQIKRIKHTTPVLLISSRMPKAMRHLQHQLGIEEFPLIAYNGGLLLHRTKVLETTEITSEALRITINACKNTSIHLSLYHQDEWYVPTMDYWARREENNTKVSPRVQHVEETFKSWKAQGIGAHKIMAMGDASEIDTLYKFLELHTQNLALYRSKPTYIEIASKAISKETAIKKILQECYPKIGLQDVMAFGDNYNDIHMLGAVGKGIAVANAKPEVLRIANEITASNIEDGVALSIEKYFR